MEDGKNDKDVGKTTTEPQPERVEAGCLHF